VRGAWNTQITWCKTNALTRWLGSILTPSGRTCPARAPRGRCAKAADLFIGVSDLGVAIDVWMAGMYHRRPMLDPQLERIGVGYARLPDGMLTAALRFENATRRGGTWPVAYPADKQADVPLEYGAESPNPIPNHSSGGYPITLQFPPFDKVTGVSAKLNDAKGNPVEFFLSDPQHPATSFGQFGVICLIPKQSLQAEHAYSVRIDATWKGKPGSWTWSFSTVSLRRIEASDDRAVAGAINMASLVHGSESRTAVPETFAMVDGRRGAGPIARKGAGLDAGRGRTTTGRTTTMADASAARPTRWRFGLPGACEPW
jgi:hypothetical protein